VFQDLPAGICVLRIGRNSYADCQSAARLSLSTGKRKLGNRNPDPFGNIIGLNHTGFREQHDKFLTAITDNKIHVATIGLGDLGDLPQYFVAWRMAVSIIILLEIIDIKDDERQGPVIVHGPLEFLIQEAKKIAIIVQSGQGVDCGVCLNLGHMLGVQDGQRYLTGQ